MRSRSAAVLVTPGAHTRTPARWGPAPGAARPWDWLRPRDRFRVHPRPSAVRVRPRRSAAGVESRYDLADAMGRVIVIALFSMLAVRLGANFLQTGRLTGLLLLASELLVVALTVLRRPATTVDRSWRARLLTALSMAGPPFVRPLTSVGLVADVVTAVVSAVGLLVSVAGKLSLGRSFGLMPANRGIVCSGLYRLVRHPIYAGYLVTHVAFLAAHPSVWNLVALSVADAALLARAVREERTLARDPEYVRYLGTVRWRVLPGVF